MSNGANHAPPFTMPPPPQFPAQQHYPGGGAMGSYPTTGGGSFGPPPLPSQPPNAMSGSGPPHIPSHPPAGSVPPPGFYDPQNTPDTAVRIAFFLLFVNYYGTLNPNFILLDPFNLLFRLTEKVPIKSNKAS